MQTIIVFACLLTTVIGLPTAQPNTTKASEIRSIGNFSFDYTVHHFKDGMCVKKLNNISSGEYCSFGCGDCGDTCFNKNYPWMCCYGDYCCCYLNQGPCNIDQYCPSNTC